jgi:hypothetical protein
LKATGASNDKRAPDEPRARLKRVLVEGSAATVKPYSAAAGSGGVCQQGAETAQNRSPIGVKGSPECRRGMLFKHFLSVSKGEILNFWCTQVLNVAASSDSGRYRHAVFTFIFASHH